jgi:hypothetical protein
MNTPSLTGAIAAAALAVLPALGTAAPAPSNTITLQNYALYDNGRGEAGPAQGHLHVSFRNDGDVPATSVVFAIRDQAGYVSNHVDDVGTFSKGVTINLDLHWLNAHDGDALEVSEVRYADGTAWTSTDSVSPTSRPQAR